MHSYVCIRNRRGEMKQKIIFSSSTMRPFSCPASTRRNLQFTLNFWMVSSDQDLRTLCTACYGLNSLRIRVEARANILERAFLEQQLQFKPCPTEDIHTANTSCFSRTSAEQVSESLAPWTRAQVTSLTQCGRANDFANSIALDTGLSTTDE